VSAILKGDEIRRYLRHQGLDADPPDQEEAGEEDKSVTLTLFSFIPISPNKGGVSLSFVEIQNITFS
jgi:hypothetical protein